MWPFKKKTKQVRSYSGASVDRLLYSWLHPATSANAEIRDNLSMLRYRSRELSRNNDFAKKFLAMVKNNVVGPSGIILQSKAMTGNNGDGSPDNNANRIIESEWKEWGKKGNCTVDSTLSWYDVQNICAETIAKDGEIIIRKINGWNNRWNFAIQLLESDYLDETYEDEKSKIKMGIQVNEWGKPTNYYLLKYHPGDKEFKARKKEYQSFKAEEIIHGFRPERPGQLRGIPWMHSAMTRLWHLENYEESELVAARVGAAKMGFFKKPADVIANITAEAKDTEGNILKNAEPGTFEELPPGMDFVSFSPDHPVETFPDFIKATLRGISAGLNVSYNSLAGDLESVNYSSYRAGSLEERDTWRALQTWFVQAICQPIYAEWLYWSMVGKALTLPVQKYDRFLNVVWRPRGWDWVDPEKDAEAARKEILSGFRTRSQIVSEKGYELEDIYQQLAEEQELAKKYNLELKLERTPAPFGGGQTGNA